MALLGTPGDFCPSSLNLLDKIYFLNSRHQGSERKMNEFATFKSSSFILESWEGTEFYLISFLWLMNQTHFLISNIASF